MLSTLLNSLRKSDKMLSKASHFYLFSSTCLINSIIHEHSCMVFCVCLTLVSHMYEAKFTFASNICCMISQSFSNMEMLVFFQSPKVIFKHITKQILFTRPVLDSYAFLNTFHTSIFFCFVALRPKSTAMFTAGQSVHLTTQLEQGIKQYFRL